VGTSFVVTTPDGRVLKSPDLRGAVLDVADEAGQRLTVRIEDASPDPADTEGDVWLHRFSVRNPSTGEWTTLCKPGPDGTVGGFPLSGSWTGTGRHVRDPSSFTVACTSGAAGKCVRLGYKPWREINAESLWDYHQACVRTIRADYGGDGTGHTRDGTAIDIFDRLGIQQADSNQSGLTFEAAWGPEGAICVRRTRVPEVLPQTELASRYPGLANGGPDCSESTPALIWNKS
jgi:hypothetical protein